MLRALPLLLILGATSLTPAGIAVDFGPARAPISREATPDADPVAAPTGASATAHPSWTWPLEGPRRVEEPYRAPAHRFGPGHRGVDLTAAPGATVHAPADGIVAFRGVVVDRALLTIEHDGGYVSTYEPMTSSLMPGDRVEAGAPLGVVAAGGHAPAGALHVGVRLDGDYINPLLLFGEVPRSVLLPCCEAPSG